MEDDDLQDYEIDVLDSNGVITLRGLVPTREARDKAEAIARQIEGVTSVINELDVI
jgi:osmotically-inducible protein OsmY